MTERNELGYPVNIWDKRWSPYQYWKEQARTANGTRRACCWGASEGIGIRSTLFNDSAIHGVMSAIHAEMYRAILDVEILA